MSNYGYFYSLLWYKPSFLKNYSSRKIFLLFLLVSYSPFLPRALRSLSVRPGWRQPDDFLISTYKPKLPTAPNLRQILSSEPKPIWHIHWVVWLKAKINMFKSEARWSFSQNVHSPCICHACELPCFCSQPS